MAYRKALSFLFILLFATQALSTTYHVKVAGNNNLSGLSYANAWATPDKANSTIAAGDTVIFYNGTYSGATAMLAPPSGSAGDWTCYMVNPGDTVLITTLGYGTYFNNKHHVVIRGDFRIRDIDNVARIVNGSYSIRYAGIKFFPTTGRAYTSFSTQHDTTNNDLFTFGIHNIIIDSCDFVGTQPRGANEDLIGPHQLDTMWIRNCTFRKVGHYAINSYIAKHVFVSDCSFDDMHGGVNFNARSYDCVLQNSTFIHMLGDSLEAGSGIQFLVNNAIIRNNIVRLDTTCRSLLPQGGLDAFNGVSTYTAYAIDSCVNGRFYHNTMVLLKKLGSPTWGDSVFINFNEDRGGTGKLEGWQYKNNIFAYDLSDHMITISNSSNSSVSNYTHFWDGNIIRRKDGDTSEVYYAAPTYLMAKVSTLHTLYPNQWGANNKDSNPMFVDSTAANCAIASNSPAVNAAVALTTTTTGTTGTSVSVADGSWFFDGWGVMLGDSIQIGTQPAVRITQRSGNTLTISSSRTWGNGDGIYIWKNGVKYNDIGAYQYNEPVFNKVWAVDGSQQIRLKTFYNPARDKDSNNVWRGDSVHLFALKNDVVSFQLVIEGAPTGVDSINVLLDYLYNGSNFIINTTSSCSTYTGRYIESFMPQYHNITTRSSSIYWTKAYPLPDTMYMGWVPNYLLPSEAPRKFFVYGTDTMQAGSGGRSGPGWKVFPNRNTVIWFDIFVPKTAVTGQYLGEIKIVKTSRADTLMRIPLELQVHNFTLTDTSHFPLFAHFTHTGSILTRHGVTSGSAYYWNEYIKRFQFLGHRHRLDLIMSGEHIDTLKARRMRYYSGWMFNPAYGYEGPGQNVGQKVYIAALWNSNFANWPTYGMRPEQAGPYTNTLAGWQALTNNFEQVFRDSAAHVLRAVELIDEPLNHDVDGGAQRAAIDTVAKWIRSGTGVGKYIHTFIPNGWFDPWNVESVPASGWHGSISMYAQLANAASWGYGLNTKRYNTTYGADPWTFEEVRDRTASDPTPTIIGTYQGNMAGYCPNIQALDVPLTYSRLALWTMWEYNLSFLWHWTVDYTATFPEDNPWQYTSQPIDNEGNDGNLIAYGRDAYFTSDDRGLNMPLASVRLKNLRDGVRDWEMLYQCQARGILDTNWINRAGIWAAFNDFRYTQHKQDSLPSWAVNGYVVEQLRKEMAVALESYTGGGAPPPVTIVTRIDSGYVKKGMYLPNADGPGIQKAAASSPGSIPYDSLASGRHYFTGSIPINSSSVICIPLSDEVTALSGTGTKVTFKMPYTMNIKEIYAEVNTVSSLGTPTFNVKENGTTIFSTKVTIDVGAETSRTASIPYVLTDTVLLSGSVITVDIDATGTGTKGAKLWLIGRR